MASALCMTMQRDGPSSCCAVTLVGHQCSNGGYGTWGKRKLAVTSLNGRATKPSCLTVINKGGGYISIACAMTAQTMLAVNRMLVGP